MTCLQDHAAQLGGKQKLLALADQRIDGEVLSHVCKYRPLDIEGKGHKIRSRNIPLDPVSMQSTPRRELFSLTWRDLIEARVSIGLRPEFSARAKGTASRASANARMAYCSMPGLCSGR